jgi:hypothetical protein
VIGSAGRAEREEESMTIPSWNPPKELNRREQTLLKRRTKKLFGFLRQHRHELFDEGFQTRALQPGQGTGGYTEATEGGFSGVPRKGGLEAVGESPTRGIVGLPR